MKKTVHILIIVFSLTGIILFSWLQQSKGQRDVLQATTAISVGTTSASNQTQWSHTTGNNPNRILIVGSGFEGTTTVTYNGIPLTRHVSQFCLTGCQSSIWYLKNPPVGTFNIVITQSGFSFNSAGAVTLYNVDLVNTFGNTGVASGLGNSTFPRVTVNATQPNEVVLGVLSWEVNYAETIDAAGQTRLWTIGPFGGDAFSSAGALKPGGGNVTLGWQGPAQGLWAATAVAVRPAAPPPPPPSQTWSYSCSEGMEVQILEDSLYPLSVPVATTSNITSMLAQVTRGDITTQVTYSTPLPETVTKSTPDAISGIFNYYTANLRPAPDISTQIAGVDTVGDSLTAYIFRRTGVFKYATGKRVEKEVYYFNTPSHTETFAIPSSTTSRNVDVTFIVADKSTDGRLAILSATAGTVTRSVTLNAPNTSGASIVRTISLPLVPGSVTQVTATVRSPFRDEAGVGTEGDSLNFKGVNISGLCDRVIPTPTPTAPPPAGGNIQNLNFGITNFKPWIQGVCGNIRIDQGIDNPVPATAVGGPYMIGTNTSCTTPGTLYPGNSSPDLGRGQASRTNWIAGGAVYPERYSSSRPIDLAYDSILKKVQRSGPTIQLSSVCTLTNCTLPNNLTAGAYQASGDVYLNTYTVPLNTDLVFLINGDLYIRGPFTIPTGRQSSALFAVTGNIIVLPNVGVAPSSTQTSIDGFYSTDRSFIVNSVGMCNDLRLNIGGAIIFNASRSLGTFQNDRDLCVNDRLYPTISIIQRLDMILNAPPVLMYRQTVSNEVAP